MTKSIPSRPFFHTKILQHTTFMLERPKTEMERASCLLEVTATPHRRVAFMLLSIPSNISVGLAENQREAELCGQEATSFFESSQR